MPHSVSAPLYHGIYVYLYTQEYFHFSLVLKAQFDLILFSLNKILHGTPNTKVLMLRFTHHLHHVGALPLAAPAKLPLSRMDHRPPL